MDKDQWKVESRKHISQIKNKGKFDVSLSRNKRFSSWLLSEKFLGVKTKTAWGWLTFVNKIWNSWKCLKDTQKC